MIILSVAGGNSHDLFIFILRDLPDNGSRPPLLASVIADKEGSRTEMSNTRSKALAENSLYLSWAVAVVAMLGSLYYSEIAGFIPCTYCWYQRIAMYPLVILIGIAAVRKDFKQTIYVIPLAAIGFGIAVFHYLIQKTSLFGEVGTACGIIPCNTDYVNYFGFITIPFLAATAFLLILILQTIAWVASRRA